ncbi:MAG: response regulator transcription factor [Bacteroidales bacterium]|nr:response regulator transcription factor [Bacteroidales bacterium]
MEKIKLILVDDHHIVRDGFKSLLSDSVDIKIIGEAAGLKELVALMKIEMPDIIILDISLPEISGIEITAYLTENFPNAKVLILSMYTNEDFIRNAIKAGAKGYLPKNTTKKEFLQAIHAIHEGDEFFSKSISEIIMKSYVKRIKSSEDPHRKEDLLSEREIEILKLFVNGLSNQEIADKLFISIRTVESHKNHIMQKLELKSTVEMVKYAIKNNIADI